MSVQGVVVDVVVVVAGVAVVVAAVVVVAVVVVFIIIIGGLNLTAAKCFNCHQRANRVFFSLSMRDEQTAQWRQSSRVD